MLCWAPGDRVASSRFAAPPLRSGPSGDPTQSLGAMGLHGRKQASGHEWPGLREHGLPRSQPPHLVFAKYVRFNAATNTQGCMRKLGGLAGRVQEPPRGLHGSVVDAGGNGGLRAAVPLRFAAWLMRESEGYLDGSRPSGRVGGGESRKRATQDGFDNAAQRGPGAGPRVAIQSLSEFLRGVLNEKKNIAKTIG